MESQALKTKQPRICNRIEKIMSHSYRYAFMGRSRLATDIGVSRSTITRLLNGQTSPTFMVLWSITRALEQALGRSFDPRDMVSLNGKYPTSSVCELVGCSGCTPEDAYSDDLRLRPAFQPKQKPNLNNGGEDAI